VETVQFQSYVFAYSVYGGILIGILYDIYRVVKGKKKNERLFTSFWDVLFLFSVFVVVLWAVFSSSYGDIRSYVFLGFIVGFYLYEKLLSRIIVGIFHFFFRNITYFFKKTNSVAVLPLKLLFSFLSRCFNSLARILGRKKIRLRKIKRLPKQIVEDSRKYYKLIAKRKVKKDVNN
jgi:spore cortex biosynthesis protein YabQ